MPRRGLLSISSEFIERLLFTLEEFKKLTEEEMATIDKICKEEANSFVLFDPNVVRGLYRRGLVYFDVPVYPDDRFKVSRLEGFVSNREQSYEDPIEELLYAVFVVSSENSTVAELATTLQADLPQLQAAASFSCRLGWAVKLIEPESVFQDSITRDSSGITLSDDEDGSDPSISIESASREDHGQKRDERRLITGTAHVAFVVDANITSYLMMGSLSPGLKSHAVTLYEAGKLGHSSIQELCKDLSTLEGTKFEGELQEFANHAYSLRLILECLQSGGVSTTNKVVDKYGNQSIDGKLSDNVTSLVADISISGEPSNLETTEANTSGDNEINDCDPVLTAPENSVPNDDLPTTNNTPEKGISKKIRKYRVDVLRCESLAALAPATLERLFLRDFDIIVSMVPLPSSSVLPGPTGPIHFGPPSYSSMTPWMKLVLYKLLGMGPLSVILMKGQCLRLLPAPLSGSEKALIWSWDGSVVGGLGGKFEGNLVNGNVLLHCLNSILKYSAVLVQPLSRYDLDESGKIVTMDIPLPLRNFDGSDANVGEELGLCLENSANLKSLLNDFSSRAELCTVGYIRVLRLQKVSESLMFLPDNEKYEWVPLSLEFGIPLFSPKLCSKICGRIIKSNFLQTDFVNEHHDAMHSLRKMLREACSEYQATGPTAKLLYHREQAKESSSPHLINYASGRWNPFLEPFTPLSAISNEYQRLKLTNRQRCRTEVLSFDGNILRSYALAPVYEAATRPIEDLPSSNTPKPESDDVDSREVVLPGVNLLFDGTSLLPFDISACLQARLPISLIAEASAESSTLQIK